MIDHLKANGNYQYAWARKKGSGTFNSQKNRVSKADAMIMLKAHNEDKIKNADDKSALNNDQMTMIADLTAKQGGNIQAGVSSLGPKRIKFVAFAAQAASAEAQNKASVESIAGTLLEKLFKMGKDKSD